MLNRKSITFKSIQESRAKIQAIESLPNFKLRRDKFHAHFDEEYFFDREKIQLDAPLKWSDLEEIVKAMSAILNQYSVAYDGVTHALRYGNVNDISHLLDSLREAANSLTDRADVLKPPLSG